MEVEHAVIWSIAGAILSEFIKQRSKWSEMENIKFWGQLRSVAFWLTVLLLLASGGISGYFLFEEFRERAEAGTPSAKLCFAAGAGAEAFLRQLGSLAVSQTDSEATLGGKSSSEYNVETTEHSSSRPTIIDILK